MATGWRFWEATSANGIGPVPVPLVISSGGTQSTYYYGFSAYSVSTFICVYDVSDKSAPVLASNYTMSGSYFDSRMIGNDVYAVISEPANLVNGSVVLPAVYNNAVSSTIMPNSIYYTDTNDSYFTYTTFVGLNIMNNNQAPSSMTLMMGGASDMYVSQSNIYVTYPDGQDTGIYRIGINGLDLTFQAEGAVPGYIINQYSMDEYNGNFRVATTTTTGSWPKESEQNNLYVLNMNLTVVGKLENMAPGESIYAARFMGDRCYLVTFKQTDPFFVIDLSNPQAPTVAGQLNIPGYSSYLYPYDANHVIGLGQVTSVVNGVESNNLKLSLFDVTDLNNPTEIANYTVQGNYTSSTALNDPHAFLFDQQNGLLVIPVSITDYQDTFVTVPPNNATGNVSPPSAIMTPALIPASTEYWQGAYVFNVNLNSGFTLQGNVTHINSSLLDSSGFINENLNNDLQNDAITRSLYIDNTLYTVSNVEVKLNSLTNLTQIAETELT